MDVGQPNPDESPQAANPLPPADEGLNDTRLPLLMERMWITGCTAWLLSWGAGEFFRQGADRFGLLFVFITVAFSLFSLVTAIQVARLGRKLDGFGAVCCLVFGVAPGLLLALAALGEVFIACYSGR